MIKRIATLTFGLGLSGLSLAQNAAQEAQSLPTDDGAALVLKAIDDICGDSWCAGEYNFAFEKLTFDTDQNVTRLDFSIFPYDQKEKAGQANCLIAGYSSTETTLDSPHSLNWDFYEAVGECIGQAERNKDGEAKVLKAIDNICGDTWCEGDFNFAFTKAEFLTADSSTRVTYKFFPWDEKDNATEAVCTVKGFFSPEQILEEYSLNWDFYELFGECVNTNEDAYYASLKAE